jgi:hypothetical protein
MSTRNEIFTKIKERKTKAINWLKRYDNDASTILQSIDFPDFVYTTTEYACDNLEAQYQYDRAT